MHGSSLQQCAQLLDSKLRQVHYIKSMHTSSRLPRREASQEPRRGHPLGQVDKDGVKAFLCKSIMHKQGVRFSELRPEVSATVVSAEKLRMLKAICVRASLRRIIAP